MCLILFYRRIRSTVSAEASRWIKRDSLKAWLKSIRGTELEQAWLRVLIGGAVMVYLALNVFIYPVTQPQDYEVLAVSVAFFIFGVAVVARVLVKPESSSARRFLAMIVDNAVTSYCLFRIGERGAVVLFVYLFITFGNGMRYGPSYLRACRLMALAGFTVVLLFSPFWSQHLWIGSGILLAILILPSYVEMLTEWLREARQRADEANKAKGRFLAVVSHEMRTPLNGIIAMSDVLRETSLNESQGEIVDTLGTSANLLLAQIEDVLDMAKIEAGRVAIEMSPFDLGSLLTTTVKVVVPQARYKGLEVRTEIAKEANSWFSGDSHHIRQVMLNLLANAVKFTERGYVELRVRVTGKKDDVYRLRFEIEDTGIGISPDKQASIFEAFTQADDSITRKYGGTGLGTAIAKQLITL